MNIISNEILEEAMSEIEGLRAELSAMKERSRNKSHKLRELEEELRSVHDKNKKLMEKESSLRAIILQNTTPVQISDAEVNNLFGIVHQKLQAVSHSRLLTWMLVAAYLRTMWHRRRKPFTTNLLTATK